MSLTVVVVTYNSRDCVTACLRALELHLPGAERIVVDNGSADETLELVREASPGTAIVDGGGNIGFGQACNLGVQAAAHRHVLLLNPDVAVIAADPPALERLYELPSLGLVVPLLAPEAGAAGSNHVFPQRHWVPEAFDHALGPLRPRQLGARRVRADMSGDGWASGAMLLVRKDEFVAAGGFNANLFLYYEDRDLSARYRREGLPVRPTSALSAVHAGGRSSAPSDGGADRMAYSFLGFIEYLYGWEGERSARRAARLALGVSAAVDAGLSAAAAAMPWVAKLKTKHQQVAAFRRFVRDSEALRLPPAGPSYPHARRIIASV